MTDNGSRKSARMPAHETAERPLPKRFYSEAAVQAEKEGHVIVLDGRPVRTPQKRALALPVAALAEAVADEWSAQVEVIDPATMPLTRIANTGLDGVVEHEAAVREELVNFAGSDLLCYRAERPQELVERQATAWDPVLQWADRELGIKLEIADGVMPVNQSQEALAAADRALGELGPLALAAMHVLVTLSGSTLLALAVQRGHLDEGVAWAAAHIDEDWQIERWGGDAEAGERRAKRRKEFAAAARFLRLLA